MVGPAVAGANSQALITIKKTGDPTTRSKVRVYTLDGSAKAGKGYQPMTEVNKNFLFFMSRRIKILYQRKVKIQNPRQNPPFGQN